MLRTFWLLYREWTRGKTGSWENSFGQEGDGDSVRTVAAEMERNTQILVYVQEVELAGLANKDEKGSERNKITPR